MLHGRAMGLGGAGRAWGRAIVAAALATTGCDTQNFTVRSRGMAPTIQQGDKVAASRSAYRRAAPQRWDIAVFRYPVDPSRNYIKRLVGLPGEAVRLHRGDVYINGQVARKPWRVQQALWREKPRSGEAAAWTPDRPGCWTLADGELTADCRGVAEAQYVKYGRDILAYEPDDPFLPGRLPPAIFSTDVMVQFRLVPLRAGGVAAVSLELLPFESGEKLDAWDIEFPLGGAPAPLKLLREGKLAATGSDAAFPAGSETLVQVCHVDSTVLVRVGDGELLRFEHDVAPRIVERGFGGERMAVRLGCTKGNASFRNPALFVDIYYTDFPNTYAVRSRHQLRQKEYFVLGDNSPNSNDSRAWGAVPHDHLVGKATAIVSPAHRAGNLH